MKSRVNQTLSSVVNKYWDIYMNIWIENKLNEITGFLWINIKTQKKFLKFSHTKLS